MRNKMKLYERMEQKSKKQMKLYISIFAIIATILTIVVVHLSCKENDIVACILILILLLLIIVVGEFLGYFYVLASRRERDQKIRELFKDNNEVRIIPLHSLEISKAILNVMEMQVGRRELEEYTDYKCIEYVNKMIKNQEIILTAELKDDKIYIIINYEGKKYYTRELIATNFGWFDFNFSVQK